MKKTRAKSRKRPDRRRKKANPPADIPDPRTIVATDTLIAPDGRQFKILQTDQTDPYDRPARKKRRT